MKVAFSYTSGGLLQSVLDEGFHRLIIGETQVAIELCRRLLGEQRLLFLSLKARLLRIITRQGAKGPGK